MWTWFNHPGGYGRKYRWKDSECLKLKLSDIQPQEHVEAHRALVWRTKPDVILFELHFMVQTYGEHLKLLLLPQGSEDVQSITCVKSAMKTKYGGTRYWLLCSSCRHRKSVLYKTPNTERFFCRNCASGGVQYASRLVVPPKLQMVKLNRMGIGMRFKAY